MHDIANLQGFPLLNTYIMLTLHYLHYLHYITYSDLVILVSDIKYEDDILTIIVWLSIQDPVCSMYSIAFVTHEFIEKA